MQKRLCCKWGLGRHKMLVAQLGTVTKASAKGDCPWGAPCTTKLMCNNATGGSLLMLLDMKIARTSIYRFLP